MQDWPLVVLIDGDCTLCSTAAFWFAHRDRAERLVFATNHGEVARLADEPPGGDTGTIVVWRGSRRLVRSDAVLTMLAALGGGWRWAAAVARCCPRRLRDGLYDLVARRRRALSCHFGGKHLSLGHRAE